MNRPIAAGFGGAGGRLALAWATDHAERAGERLVLVHVCVPGSPLDQNSSDPAQAEVERIDPPLARAFTITRARLGRRRTELKIRSGKPEDCLTRVSADVATLVIGDGEGDRTVRRVVRHTRCPVVVVRPSTAAAEAPFAGHVVVGLDASMPNHAVLDFAFRYTAEHHLPLVAVHVCGTGNRAAAGWPAGELAPWARKYPTVPLRSVVLPGSVADRLISCSAGAHLLVVGDKRRGVIGRARTGDVPLTVATETPCPVAVVPLGLPDGRGAR